MQDSMLGTKTRIFNTALRLFATRGVENATTRDIADEVGIKVASIYNHYTSKEQLVEECYDLFDLYFNYYDSARLTESQCKIILQKGTKKEIIDVLGYQFPEELEENMIYAMTVLFSRIHIDEKAVDKYTTMIDNSLRFLNSFLELGIELGRFEEFNVKGVSLLFLSARLFAAQAATLHHETLLDLHMDQHEMMPELIKHIPFKY